MKELKGTKTYANLEAAFAGESKARNKYTYYASKARKDGYIQIAELFEETANNEKEHAKIWFKLLMGGEVPATPENLVDAAAGENYEWTDMYQRMGEEAKEEGFDQIANLFFSVAKIGESPRGALPEAALKHQGRHRVQPRRRPHLAVRKLRAPGHRQKRSGALPRVQASQVVLPPALRKLLIQCQSQPFMPAACVGLLPALVVTEA